MDPLSYGSMDFIGGRRGRGKDGGPLGGKWLGILYSENQRTKGS